MRRRAEPRPGTGLGPITAQAWRRVWGRGRPRRLPLGVASRWCRSQGRRQVCVSAPPAPALRRAFPHRTPLRRRRLPAAGPQCSRGCGLVQRQPVQRRRLRVNQFSEIKVLIHQSSSSSRFSCFLATSSCSAISPRTSNHSSPPANTASASSSDSSAVLSCRIFA